MLPRIQHLDNTTLSYVSERVLIKRENNTWEWNNITVPRPNSPNMEGLVLNIYIKYGYPAGERISALR